MKFKKLAGIIAATATLTLTSALGTSASLAVSTDCTNFTPNADLSYCSLGFADLHGVDLHGADLSHADLINANLTGTNLRDANLTGATIKWSPMNDANLTGANLTDATIQTLNISGAIFTNATLTSLKGVDLNGTAPTLPANWELKGGYLIGPGARLTYSNFLNLDLSNVNLEGANLDHLTATGTNFTNANLRSTNLTYANLGNANLTNADLTSTNLSNSTVAGANLTNADFRTATLNSLTSGTATGSPIRLPSGWAKVGGYLVGPGASLIQANFADLDLTNVDLTGANISNAQFIRTNITNVNFSGTSTNGVVSLDVIGTPLTLPSNWSILRGRLLFPRADLSGANFSNLDLRNVVFDRTTLASVNFSNSNLSGQSFIGYGLIYSNFTGATLDGTNFTDAALNSATFSGIQGTPILSSQYRLVNGVVFGSGLSLSSANLTNFNFTGIDLRGMDLAGANLSNANLSDQDLRQTSMAQTVMFGTNLTGANLTGLNLDNVASENIIGNPLLPTGWQKFNGFLVGPGANLTSRNFSNLDLRSLNLRGVYLAGANLTDTDLRGVDLSGADLHQVVLIRTNVQGTNLTGAVFTDAFSSALVGTPAAMSTGTAVVNGYFIAPGISLAGLDLHGKNLSGLNLSGANLAGTNLSGANLTGVQMVGANLTNTNLAGANLTNLMATGVTGTPTGLPNTVTFSSGSILGIFAKTPTPKFTGTLAAGQTLKSTTGTWDKGVTFTYQWLRDGSPIGGATSANYVLVGDDFGHRISVAVTGHWTGGVTNTQTSTQSTKTVGIGTMKSVAPRASGRAKVGLALVASTAAWTPGATITYRWLLNGKVISGATTNQLILLPSFGNKKIVLEVTQNAPGFKKAVKTSASVKVAK